MICLPSPKPPLSESCGLHTMSAPLNGGVLHRHRTAALAARLGLGLLLLAGCGHQDAPSTPEADQLVLNEFVDRQMDALHAALNQQTPQEPPLPLDGGAIAPAGEVPPLLLPLGAGETRELLSQAVQLAEEGKLDEALHLLSTHAPEDGLRASWLARRAELLALRFEMVDVRPLVARCAAFALQQDPNSGAAGIRRKLRGEWAWAWRYEGARAAVVIPLPSADGSGQLTSEQAFFHVQGYTNVGIPQAMAGVHLPLEHYHLAVFHVASRAYVASYTVQSRELLGGERVFFLQRQLGGRPDVLKVYDQLPDYQTAAADTQAHLEGTLSTGTL